MTSNDVMPIGEFRELGLEGHKRCRQCGEIKPIDDFCKEKRLPDGHTTLCKPCKAFNTRQRRNNPEKREYYRQKRAEWRANQRRRHGVHKLRKKARERYNARPREGQVYVFRFERYFKIGVTTSGIERRIEAANTWLPKPVEVVHTLFSNDVYRAEWHFHDRFSDKRCNGEWFELSDQDLAFITAHEELIYD